MLVKYEAKVEKCVPIADGGVSGYALSLSLGSTIEPVVNMG
jgi:hypothetical protein